MIVAIVYHYDDPEDKNYTMTLKIFKDEKTALKARDDSVEEFREQAIKIIEQYRENETVDPKWSRFDVENIIECEDDDEEIIRNLSFECYKIFNINPFEVTLHEGEDVLLSTRLDRLYL